MILFADIIAYESSELFTSPSPCIHTLFPSLYPFPFSVSRIAAMQSLLRWSIENSSNDNAGAAAGAAPRTDLDPGIIDAILGRPDAELMKEALAKAQDASLNDSARLTALDDLEMVQYKLPPPHSPVQFCAR